MAYKTKNKNTSKQANSMARIVLTSAFIVLASFVLFSFGVLYGLTLQLESSDDFDPSVLPEGTEFPESVCYFLDGKRNLWIQDKELVGLDRIPLLNMSYNVADEFIKGEIYYLYFTNLEAHEQTKADFEERWMGSWNQYEQSNYTINCGELQ